MGTLNDIALDVMSEYEVFARTNYEDHNDLTPTSLTIISSKAISERIAKSYSGLIKIHSHKVVDNQLRTTYVLID